MSGSRAVLLLEAGDNPHLLAAVRAFTATGWRVGIGGRSRSSRVARSRHVRRVHLVPPLEDGVAALASGINAAHRAAGYDLVFPADDAELLSLSETRAALDVRFPYPAHPIVLRAVDKLALTSAAAEVGLAVPVTVAAGEQAMADVRPPLVVKPALHWTPGCDQRERNLPVRMCLDESDVRTVVAQITDAGGRALLQRPVDGDLTALTVVTGADGDLLAAVAQHTSMLTLSGTSARAETVTVDPHLLGQVRDLLTALGWTGLANLQFLNPVGGPPTLIDFNARFYGSIALADAAGVNVAAIWAGAAIGAATAPTPATARPGVRFQALEKDLQRARRQRRGGLVRDVVTTVAYARRAAHSTGNLADPLPGIVTAARILRGLAGPGRASDARTGVAR